MRKKGEASRFKSTLINPYTQEINVYNDWNIARKDEGEWARSPASPTLSGVAPGFWNVAPQSFYFRAFGCFGPEKGRKA